MMRSTIPAPGMGQGLDNNSGESNSSIKLKITKDINRLQVLNEIANKWVDKGCYSNSGRALQALIGGKL